MVYLFTSTFGEKTDFVKGGIPIEVGAACRSNFQYDLRDDIGDNISQLNPYFGELTGLYWIWKNFNYDSQDIIGFSHYNKYLNFNIENMNAEWIVREGVNANVHDYKSDIEVLESVLKEKYTNYFPVWSSLYKEDGSSMMSNSCFAAQLFYTHAEEFDRYCEFLFGILFDIYEEIGGVDREPFHKRYLAFLGERLLSVYLYYTKLSYIEADMMYDTKFKKIKRFLPSSIKNSELYRILSKRFGRGSSYRN